ncbi:amp-dependent synthetase ligase [Staphylotrichum tortipilum]|uniref:Amp-dependent synthetase ligase n=1 Tax=Staphylotrichum tortipilum TaxID=2831512 RepID=A0AAN6MBL2_9PEZI|nr:amp-dependent synthetase ligase [Staphylotrichum longicolle]
MEEFHLSKVPPRSITDLIEFVRRNSPFYASFWGDIYPKSLEDLPIVDHALFWDQNTCLESQVVTSRQKDGIIFTTGGTTANPKVSFYSRDELHSVVITLAECLRRCGVIPGDRVANLFYTGDLYGSFLLYILSIHHLPTGAIQLPIAGHIPVASMAQHITTCAATVLLGTVTTLSQLASHLATPLPTIRLLLFSGEACYPDQVPALTTAFPNATLHSLVYGAMDIGVVGLPPEKNPTPNDLRVHEVNAPEVKVEIINPSGQPTTTPDEPGRLVVTHATRRLMPIVRYPSGDRAEWVDYSRGLFRILGRDRTAIRLGPVSIDFVDLRKVIVEVMGERVVGAVQAVIEREEGRDRLTVVVGGGDIPETEGERLELEGGIAEGLGRARPMWREHVERELVGPLKVRFGGLVPVSGRSGKCVEVVDLRGTT